MSTDLGGLTGLATALGLLDDSGAFVADWLEDPGRHLTSVLRVPHQREALVGFVDEVLGGSTATTGPDGEQWLPVVEVEGGALTVAVVLRPTTERVEVGVGVRIAVTSAGGVGCAGTVHLPVFAQPVAPGDVVVLAGTDGTSVDVDLVLTFPPGTETAGVALGGVGLGARVPTWAGGEPGFDLSLLGLRLPGSSAPRDLAVAAARIDELDDAVLELVLGLVRAQAAALPSSDPLRGLASLLGLAEDDVPDFPVEDLLARGPRALADWLALALAPDSSARAAWLAGLAGLLEGEVVDGSVEVDLLPAHLRIGLVVLPGPNGGLLVTPRLALRVDGPAGVVLALEAEPLRLDLASGAVVALPRLSLTAVVSGAGSTPLLAPVAGPSGLSIGLRSLQAGFALDATRRPQLVLEARDADVGATHFAVLDLTSPDALAAAASGVVTAAAASLLAGLDDLGAAVSVLLGLGDVPGGPALPRIDAAQLLSDPLAALAGFWQELLTESEDTVRAVLELVRDAVSDTAAQAVDVRGTGEPADPWRVPLAAGLLLTVRRPPGRLELGIEVAVTAADLGGSGIPVTLAVEARVVDLVLGASRSAAFLPSVHAALRFGGAAAPFELGAPPLQLRAGAVGLAVAWTSGSAPSVQLVLDSVELLTPGGSLALPLPTFDSAGRLAFDEDDWHALERLIGAAAAEVAQRTGASALLTVAALLGWADLAATPAASGGSSGLRLSLAELVADPAAALEAHLRGLLDVGSATSVELVVQLVSLLLAPSGVVLGTGRPSAPWLLPLLRTGLDAELAAGLLPSLLLCAGPDGLDDAATRPGPLPAWQPGDPGLDPFVLSLALQQEAALDDDLADLLAGRGDLVTGIDELLARLVGTDGLVTLPEDLDLLPTGVTGHRVADLLHSTRLDLVDLADVLGAAPPATVVHVALAAPGSPDVLPVVGEDHRVDLTGAGLPPESFSVALPAAPTGAWAVRLAGRADAGGSAGQVARLARVLPTLAGSGPTLLVAHGGAGHAVVRAAAAGLPGVTGVVTVGTPWSPVTVDTLDRLPAGESLRLLGSLLDLVEDDEDEELDDDLGAARSLLALWTGLDALGDPLGDLRAGESPAGAGATPVHAVVGSLAVSTVSRAVTAVVAAGLAQRARSRAEAGHAEATALCWGARLPLVRPVARGGIVSSVVLDVDLPVPGGGGHPPRLVLRCSLGAADGWLVGGPDAGRTAGAARPLAVRRLTAEVRLPLGAGEAEARLDLHDVRAFGVRRARWTVAGGDGAPAGSTPLLPEARAVLGQVAARLEAGATTDAGLSALVDALRALGVLSPAGGVDPVSLERLLLDPSAVTAEVRATLPRVESLAAALRTLVGTAGSGTTVRVSAGGSGEPVAVTATLDLATGDLALTAAGAGALPWSGTLEVTGRAFGGSLRLGPDVGAGDAAYALALVVGGAPLTAELQLRRPGAAAGAAGVTRVRLWPSADVDAVGDLLAEVAPAAVLQVLLDALRGQLADASAAAGTAVDAVLDVLGLLRPAAPAGPDSAEPARRALVLPAGLVADPAAWLAALPGAGLPALVPALLEAVRGLLGATGTPGRLQVAPGVAVTAARVGDRLVVAADVDGSAFAGAGAAGRLLLSGSAGVSVGADGVLPAVALGVGATGVGQVRLGVQPATGVRLSVLPDAGTEIVLLPAGPGLGGAVAEAALGAAVRALPALLDAVASNDPAGAPDTPQEVAGRLVVRLGDALALRSGTPLRFQHAALSTFGTDPPAALLARATHLGLTGLDLLSEAVRPLLAGTVGRSVEAASGALVVSVGPVTVRWSPTAGRVSAELDASGLPGVERVAARVTVDLTGLQELTVTLGPAELDADVVVLRPYVSVSAGLAPVDGRAVEVGLGLGGDRRFAARWALDPLDLALVAVHGTELRTAPEDVALAAVSAVLDLAGSLVLSVPAVGTALDTPLLSTTARELLTGVLLEDTPAADRLDPTLLDPDALLARLSRVLTNLDGLSVTVDDALTLSLDTDDGVLGLVLSLSRPWLLGGTDVTVTLEAEGGWITPPVAEGLTLRLLSVVGGVVTFRPGLAVGGVGIRLARASGPLLDTGLRIDSVALHLYASVHAAADLSDPPAVGGGARIELAGLGVAIAGASGGDNPVAAGMVSGAGSAEDTPRPRFSPALAVQQHPGAELQVSFTAGDPPGPWWVVVQRGFGPLYLDQVGLAVTQADGSIATIGVLLDASVSILGLTATVDDLSLTWSVRSGSPFDPDSWRVDLAGLAITADIAGLALAGGFRRFPSAAGGVEYLGMLVARLAAYGISVYGGYGMVGPPQDQFASLFLFGAVNGPIGGPPAFFVTGLGGGFGINRALTYPSDLSQFGSYPFIKALDPAARPGDPMTELESVRQYFPAQRGSFWFAAGVSFTCFALVDGVAVVAVQIGDGFELALLGLARMALPRPEAAIVSVELGLLARFSTREGLLLVQAQLTENSWLLFPSMRLTGGFAFAAWFGGPNRGQFVLTLGGYHPSFSRDGYPVVPRLGVEYRLGDWLEILGQSYFALTSEALMAGVRLEVHASLGPAWADLVLGADGIVFFDPFWLEVTVYASISAGVTIDVWIGEIDISVSISARVTVSGPPFHGRAEFSVGPVDLEVEFGEDPVRPTAIAWDAFVPKYLEESAPGTAHVLTAVPGRGAAAPKGGGTDGGAQTPDGSDARPYVVVPEFELTITSTAPVRELDTGRGLVNLPTTPEVSAAPMRQPARPRVQVSFVGPAGNGPIDRADRLGADPQRLGAFAIGTWGPAQAQDDAKVPSGDVLKAVDRVLLSAAAVIATSPAGAPDIPFRQVEVHKDRLRRPLPFVPEGASARRRFLGEGAAELAGLVPAVSGSVLATAATLLTERGGRSPAVVRAWAGERASAPLLGSLGEGLGRAAVLADVVAVAPEPEPLAALRPPVVAAVLASHVSTAAPSKGRAAPATGSGATTVSAELMARLVEGAGGSASAWPSLSPPVLAEVDAGLDPAVPAQLLRVGAPAGVGRDTVLAGRELPLTRSGRSGIESVGGRGADPATRERLAGLAERLAGNGLQLDPGAMTVLALPDADRDVEEQRRPVLVVRGSSVRLLAVAAGGVVVLDVVVPEGAETPVPAGVRTIALSPCPLQPAAVCGWDTAGPLPYLGDEVFAAAGAAVRSSGRVPRRRFAPVRTGWTAASEVVSGATAVTTEFDGPVGLVAIALEGGAGDDLELGLDGATRPLGAAGRPEPPAVVADGPRAVAVFRVLPVDGARVAVTVATGATRRLAGVAAVRSVEGAPGDPTAFARTLAELGFPEVVPPPVPLAPAATAFWKEG